ncbi:ABC-F family ATP-binding cassette domain-containing protein [Chitinophaga ginsengisoli]|uniref:ATPase subunit of ABC transporter with duplicated ATPase domains n=1 Tax=Chitinophaga ginsengisoli TaxID=363837 RepID=A0A2P8FA13_9BACT|nr:ABC-F family ATP-binding cassette domain-containing protein [Chitinophaga ginsengisoli]PSL18571.1 ATPase subunit of ABC transporter with duplicated ATPase domains [Chitinophaga ginsengisoli]
MGVIIRSLSYIHPDNAELFQDLNLILNDGDKAALVGINGAGKSTLLRIISGKLQPTAGEIISAEQPWYVPQHLGDYDTWSVARALGAEAKLKALQAILAGDTDLQHFTVLEDNWDIENKVKQALEKWGLIHLHESRLLGSLSGGQKTRVFLAAMEMNSPALILLDEPSNHLDRRTRMKLYHMIMQSKSTMLIVSHDRSLLNLMNKILELNEKGIEVFGGNFDFYQSKKMEKVHALHASLNAQSKALRESEKKAKDMGGLRAQQELKGRSVGLSNSIPRIIAGGLKNKAERSTARMLNAHEEKIASLRHIIEATKAQIEEYELLKFNIKAPERTPGELLIEMVDVNFKYNENTLWHNLNFQIKSGERVQIEGDNGSGKTTLLKMITRELQPFTGSYNSTGFSYFYLDQDYSAIDPTLSIYQQIESYNKYGLEEGELKQLLISSQFNPEYFDRKCAGLSGGEKMKLSLSCMLISNQAPDVLILDEPTNNLDVQSLGVLTFAVKNFEGTLLVISHDEYFINEIGIDYSIILT